MLVYDLFCSIEIAITEKVDKTLILVYKHLSTAHQQIYHTSELLVQIILSKYIYIKNMSSDSCVHVFTIGDIFPSSLTLGINLEI